MLKTGILPPVQLFTSGFYTNLKSLVSCSKFLSCYLTALFTLSHFIFIPIFLLRSCKCPGLSSPKKPSTILGVHIRFDRKAEPYLKPLKSILCFHLANLGCKKSLPFPLNLQLPLPTQPAAISSSNHFRSTWSTQS